MQFDMEDDEVYIEYYNREVKNSKLENIANADLLYQSFLKCKKNVSWKYTTQRYEINLLKELRKDQISIRNNTYKQRKTKKFIINERGHHRLIKPVYFNDRVILRAFDDKCIIPVVDNYTIYDNGASQINKGITFSRNRFKLHLLSAIREFGEDCYILLIDFSKYFDNIQHVILEEMFQPYISAEEYEFFCKIISHFEVNMSAMSEEEYANCMNIVFNSLEYKEPESDNTDNKKMMKKSLGIGCPLSQQAGIFYPHRIDNYVKIVRGIKYYGRYMDDSYIITGNKDELLDIFDNIKEIAKSLGIFINKKKSRIIKINFNNIPIPYLKINYIYDNKSDKLIQKINKATIVREHRRLLKFYKLYTQNRMTIEDISQCYKGWRGEYKKYDSGYDIKYIDDYFYKLYKIKPWK